MKKPGALYATGHGVTLMEPKSYLMVSKNSIAASRAFE